MGFSAVKAPIQLPLRAVKTKYNRVLTAFIGVCYNTGLFGTIGFFNEFLKYN